MEILSLNESLAVSRQADTLCILIDENTEALREGRFGKRTRLNGVVFELIQKGRNAVYRISSKHGRWFLKLACSDNRAGIEGEILGFQFMREHFRDVSEYHHPAAVRASVRKGFILASEIPGEQLNYQLYRACLPPWRRNAGDLDRLFHHCGRVLGLFHKRGVAFPLREIKSGLPNTLQRRLERVKKPDELTGKIGLWYAQNAPFDTPGTIVHGNCTFRNIFGHGEQVSILDFESVGHGSPYNDLSRVCSDVIMTRTALWFPWKKAYSALEALLQGYRSTHQYDPEILLKYIALYILDRYVQVYNIKREKESVSGIPLSGEKHRWLLQSLLNNDVRAVLPG